MPPKPLVAPKAPARPVAPATQQVAPKPAAPAARPATAAPAAAAGPVRPTAAPPARPARAPAPAAVSPIAKRLAAMRKAWDDKKEVSRNMTDFGIKVEVGDYICRLTGGTVKLTDSWFGMILNFTVVDGDSTGEQIDVLGEIKEDRMIFIQRDMRKLGLDVDAFPIDDIESQVAAAVEAAPGAKIHVGMSEKGNKYANIIDGLVLDENNTLVEPAEEPVAEPDAEAPVEEAPAEEEVVEEAPAEEPTHELQLGEHVQFMLSGAATVGEIKKFNDDGSMNVTVGPPVNKTYKITPDKVLAMAEVQQ